MALWSSGYDATLSRYKQEFDSPTPHLRYVESLFDSGYVSESFSSFDEFAEDEISEIGIFLTKIDKEKKSY